MALELRTSESAGHSGFGQNAPESGRFVEIPGGVTAPVDYEASGVHCGIRKVKKDLAIVRSRRPASGAAVFTTNKVKAAPIKVSMKNVAGGIISAFVVNSGVANACTGDAGMQDAIRMVEETARQLSVPAEQIIVSSTGVIGERLPMNRVLSGISQAASALSGEGGEDAALAIMTTDTFSKQVAIEFEIGGVTARLGGMAKGSGMIHPNMATMLGFLTTDVAIEPGLLSRALRNVVNRTFNRITVDGDTSTNDMVAIMANGAAGNPPIAAEDSDYETFETALEYVCTRLAKLIARDGEGASKLIEVRAINACSVEAAKKIARTIANSNLVKTAVFGEDANWGRIICAAGYSGADFDPDRTDIYIGDIKVAEDGAALPFDEEAAREALSGKEVILTVDLKQGHESAVIWTCDLTYDYVKINASYRT